MADGGPTYNDISNNSLVNKAGVKKIFEEVINYVDSNTYTLPAATTSTLGGVKIQSSTLGVGNDGTISTKLPAPPASDGYFILKRYTSGINQTVGYLWESITVGGSY